MARRRCRGRSASLYFVIVFHSFSAVKPKDETYLEMRPNRIVIRRLEKMFQYLAANGDRFRVETLGNLAHNLQSLEKQSPRPVIAELGLMSSTVRKAVQLWNNLYSV